MDIQRFQHAIYLRDSGELEQAISELRSMYEDLRDVSQEEAGLMLLNEAICRSRLGLPLEECKTLLNQASMLFGSDPTKRALVDCTDASFYMSHANRDPAKALEKFDAVLRREAEILRDPQARGLLYGEIQLRRGLLLVEFRRFEEARDALEEVLTLEAEKDASFHFNLGRCYRELHEWEKAKQQFVRAIEMGLPEDRLIRTHFYLGTIYFQSGSLGKALQEFEFCELNIKRSTMPPRVLYKWLAVACQAAGREENARNYSELAAKL